jgi:hypothetical protein
MAQEFNKPIPPRQQEISKKMQEPYKDGEGRFNQGNPNDSRTSNSDRGNQISFKGDDTKLFSLGIKDIDEAIFYYIKNIIKPTVIQNGVNIDVPILYGDAEKWTQIQKRGFLRDRKGDILCPFILIKRNDIAKERSLTNKIDANNPNNYSIYQKAFNGNNVYSQFSALNSTLPKKQFYVVVMPDFVTINYSIVISTYFIEQNNKIVEAMNYASDSYWGDPEKFKFRARIDSFTTATEIKNGAERIATTNFNLKLYGYIVPDTYIKDINSINKFVDRKATINFNSENIIQDFNNLPDVNTNL